MNRSGGIVSLKPVFEAVSKGVDNTASELAIARLDKEIAKIEEKLEPIQWSVKAAGFYKIVNISLVIVGSGVLFFSYYNTCGFIVIVSGLFVLLDIIVG